VSFGQQGDVLEAALRATVAGALMVEHRGALAVLPFDRHLAQQRLEWLKGTLEPLKMEIQQPCAWTNAN
jgi:hypothetical protein